MFESIKKLFNSTPSPAEVKNKITPQPININPPKKVSHVRLLSRLERLYIQQSKTPADQDLINSIKVQKDMLIAAGHDVPSSITAVRKSLSLLGSK